MTITIQTSWTYELFEEAVTTFEKSLNRILHIRCSHDTKTMLENIATWSKDRGHSVLTVDEDRMTVTIKKKPEKIKGVYQPKGPSKPPEPPTSNSNAVKPARDSDRLDGAEEMIVTLRRKNGCQDCGRHRYCERAKHIDNYGLNSGCHDFITEATYDVMFNKGVHVIHTVPTYNEFANIFADMPAEQEWELIKLWENYVDRAKQSWSTRYTYCTGCFKDVRRDNTYTELTEDGKLLIRCKGCNTIWYVKDAE